jgi:hypothetical protein
VALRRIQRAGTASGAGSGRHSRSWPPGGSGGWSGHLELDLEGNLEAGLEEDHGRLELDLEGILEAGLEEDPEAGTAIWSLIWNAFSRQVWKNVRGWNCRLTKVWKWM